MTDHDYPSVRIAQTLFNQPANSRKYTDALCEWLDSMNDCESGSFGDVERGGYYQLFTFRVHNIPEHADTHAAIIRTNNDGFVYTISFGTIAAIRAEYRMIEAEYDRNWSESDAADAELNDPHTIGPDE